MGIAANPVGHGHHRLVRADDARHYLSPTAARELRNARRRLGMSQRAAARATGVSQGHVAHLELCQRAPSIDVARALVAGLRLGPGPAAVLMAEAVPDAGRSWRAPGLSDAQVLHVP